MFPSMSVVVVAGVVFLKLTEIGQGAQEPRGSVLKIFIIFNIILAIFFFSIASIFFVKMIMNTI